MKLGMKFTLAVFLACLTGLIAGGAWLQWASWRDTQIRIQAETRGVLAAMASSLAPMVRARDQEAVGHFLGFVRGILPLGARIEVNDRSGARLAASGVPPREGTGIYYALSEEGEGMVGSVQVFLDESDLRKLSWVGQRPGGTAIFVAMAVTWIAAEVLAAFLLLSPIKKLHRTLLRALRREGAVDLELLTEELNSRGNDEVEAILLHTRDLILRVRRERALGQLEVVSEVAPGTEARG